MIVKRSGESVRDAVMTGGLSAVAVAPLLEPWLTALLDVLASRVGVTLPDGYHAQAVIAVTAVLLGVVAHLKVRALARLAQLREAGEG